MVCETISFVFVIFFALAGAQQQQPQDGVISAVECAPLQPTARSMNLRNGAVSFAFYDALAVALAPSAGFGAAAVIAGYNDVGTGAVQGCVYANTTTVLCCAFEQSIAANFVSLSARDCDNDGDDDVLVAYDPPVLNVGLKLVKNNVVNETCAFDVQDCVLPKIATIEVSIDSEVHWIAAKNDPVFYPLYLHKGSILSLGADVFALILHDCSSGSYSYAQLSLNPGKEITYAVDSGRCAVFFGTDKSTDVASGAVWCTEVVSNAPSLNMKQNDVFAIRGGGSVVWCDIDGDSDEDIAVVDVETDEVVFFIQTGMSSVQFVRMAKTFHLNSTGSSVKLSCAKGLAQNQSTIGTIVVCPIGVACVALTISSETRTWVGFPLMPGVSAGTPLFLDFDNNGSQDAIIVGTAAADGATPLDFVFLNVSCSVEVLDPLHGSSSSSFLLVNTSSDAPLGPGTLVGLTAGEIAAIVVGSVIFIAIVVGVLVGAVMLGRWQAKRDQKRSKSIPLEAGGMAELAGLNQFECADGALGVTVSPAELLFGSESTQLAVDKEYHDKLTITGTSSGLHPTEFKIVLPEAQPHKCTLAVATENGVLSVGKDKVVSVDVALTMHCTTHIATYIAVVVGSKKGFARIAIRAQSQLSIKLDASEIELGDTLGTGSYGTVYRGTWRGQQCAIKSYNESVFQNASMVGDVNREVEMCSAMRHPNIITFFGKAQLPDKYYLVMELAEHGSLGGLIKKGPLPVAFKVRVALDVAKGMAFLHGSQIIHRDLKTDNVLVMSMDPGATVVGKLSDFNTSRFLGTDAQRTKTKGVGTPVFMSPEILNGEKYDYTADIYSFGVLLWQLWTQEEPYGSFETQFAIYRFVLEGKRLPFPEDVLPEFKDVAERAWSPVPSERPPFKDLVPILEAIHGS